MPSKAPPGRLLEERVATIFRQAGWRVSKPGNPKAADLLVRRGDMSYIVEVKHASEGRPDRLIPLLAQAILQARAWAKQSDSAVAPLAVVGAPHVRESIPRDLERFAREFAPDMAVGIVDRDGFSWFRGPGLDELNARAPGHGRAQAQAPEQPTANLFSDLNQWMLKVLLAPKLPPDLLRAPRQDYANVSQLAAASGVSVMSAFRLVRQLRAGTFLDEESSVLRLVRVEELLRLWLASYLGPKRDLGASWILRRGLQLQDVLRSWNSQKSDREENPRACLGLFAAADALGIGLVRGVAPYLHLERAQVRDLKALGLSVDPSFVGADVIVRIPSAPESTFRGAVTRNGVPVADVIQVWLDVGAHPARGREQADLIFDRLLRQLLGADS
jgi:hypothetical protein